MNILISIKICLFNYVSAETWFICFWWLVVAFAIAPVNITLIRFHFHPFQTIMVSNWIRILHKHQYTKLVYQKSVTVYSSPVILDKPNKHRSKNNRTVINTERKDNRYKVILPINLDSLYVNTICNIPCTDNSLPVVHNAGKIFNVAHIIIWNKIKRIKTNVIKSCNM